MTNEDSTEAWDHLSLFLSRDILQRRYKARHGGEINAGKAHEIISHLEQGKQYFVSAESAGALAGPLEQYYGVLSLSRAIVLYLNPSQRETSLKRSHGLHATLQGDGEVENIEIEVQDGTFSELLTASQNAECAIYYAPSDSDGLIHGRSIIRSLPRPEIAARFSLTDLLSRTPDLRTQFQAAFAIRSNCHEGRVSLFGRSLDVIIWRREFPLPSPGELRGPLGISPLATEQVTPNESIQYSARIADGCTILDALPHMMGAPRANIFVELYPGGWALNEISTYFAASHTLSMLVRYHPSRWANMVSHQKGDRLFPVVQKLRALIQANFIRLVVSVLAQT